MRPPPWAPSRSADREPGPFRGPAPRSKRAGLDRQFGADRAPHRSGWDAYEISRRPRIYPYRRPERPVAGEACPGGFALTCQGGEVCARPAAKPRRSRRAPRPGARRERQAEPRAAAPHEQPRDRQGATDRPGNRRARDVGTVAVEAAALGSSPAATARGGRISRGDVRAPVEFSAEIWRFSVL